MNEIQEVKNCETCVAGSDTCGCGQCGGPDCVRCKACCGATCGTGCTGCECAKKCETCGPEACACPKE